MLIFLDVLTPMIKLEEELFDTNPFLTFITYPNNLIYKLKSYQYLNLLKFYQYSSLYNNH